MIFISEHSHMKGAKMKLTESMLRKIIKEELDNKSFKKGDKVEVTVFGDKKVGTIKKVHELGDMADVDFGKGDVYGITFRRMKKAVSESRDYDPLGDGGFPAVGTGPDGMPRRNKRTSIDSEDLSNWESSLPEYEHLDVAPIRNNKRTSIDSGKYYILLQNGLGQYELSAGPFDTSAEVFRDTLRSYDRFDRQRMQVVRGTYDGRAEKVDSDGRSYGDEIPARNIY